MASIVVDSTCLCSGEHPGDWFWSQKNPGVDDLYKLHSQTLAHILAVANRSKLMHDDGGEGSLRWGPIFTCDLVEMTGRGRVCHGGATAI